MRLPESSEFCGNIYAYVGGNPLKWVVPDGLSPADVQKIVDTLNRKVDSMTSMGARNPIPYVTTPPTPSIG